MAQEIITKNLKETQELARKFSKDLKAGSVVALYGDLGAGKTSFVQGLAEGLGYAGKVFSPTFIFVRPYKLSRGSIKTIYHIDMYRVEEESDLRNIGIDEFLADDQAVSVIEWPEKIEKHLPKKTIKVRVVTLAENERKISFA